MTELNDKPQAVGISPETRTKIESWVRKRAKGLGSTIDGLGELFGLPPSDLEAQFAAHNWTPVQIGMLADTIQISQTRAREILKGKLEEWSVERPADDTKIARFVGVLYEVGDPEITWGELGRLIQFSKSTAVIMTPPLIAELLKQFRAE